MINLNNKHKLLFVMILTIIGIYIGFEYILPLFIPFILAYFIAWILHPVVEFLNNKLKIPRLIAGILSLSILTIGMAWSFFYLCGLLIQQIITLLKNMPIYLEIIAGQIDKFCENCDKFFGIQVGTVKEFYNSNMDGVLNTVKTKIMPIVTSKSLNFAIGIVEIIGVLLIILVCILLLIKDQEQYSNSFKKSLFYKDIHLVTSKLSETGVAYLRTQALMLIFISLLCSAGLILIKNKYALLIGIGIGIFDAFPVLGSGLILVPWGVISLINHDIYSAAVLFTLYLGCQIIRQFLEPKLIGNRIGIKPVYTLMGMYVGVRVFGFSGFILGPLGLVIITTIIKEFEKRLENNQAYEE